MGEKGDEMARRNHLCKRAIACVLMVAMMMALVPAWAVREVLAEAASEEMVADSGDASRLGNKDDQTSNDGESIKAAVQDAVTVAGGAEQISNTDGTLAEGISDEDPQSIGMNNNEEHVCQVGDYCRKSTVQLTKTDAKFAVQSTDWVTALTNNYARALGLSGYTSFYGLCPSAVSYQLLALGITTSAMGLPNGKDVAGVFNGIAVTSGGYPVTYTAGTGGWNALDSVSGNGVIDGYYLVSYTSNSAPQYGHVNFFVIERGTVYIAESYNDGSYPEGTARALSYSSFKSRWQSLYPSVTGVVTFDYDPIPDYNYGPNVTLPNGNGVYTISSTLDPRFYVEAEAGGTADGTNVRMWLSENDDCRRWWFIKNDDDGTYSIINATSGRALDVNGASKEVGANVQIWADEKVDQQRWYVQDCGNGVYALKAKHSRGFLDISGGIAYDGANVQQYYGNNTGGQRFFITPSYGKSVTLPQGDGIYNIASKLDPTYLVKAENGAENADNVCLWTGEDSDNSRWRFSLNGDGTYSISSATSGKVLDVAGSSYEAGANVHMWEDSKLNQQKWYIEECGGGVYALKAVHSNFFLDASNGLASNGTNVMQYPGNYSDAQQYYITPSYGRVAQGLESGLYSIASGIDGKHYVGLESKSISDGANIQLCESYNEETCGWRFMRNTDGTYTIKLHDTNMVLDVNGASLENCANVQLWTNDDVNQQRWYVEDRGDGTYALKSKCSRLFLDVADSEARQGANLWQYVGNGTSAQSFIIRPVAVDGDTSIDISSATVSFSQPSLTYRGTPIEPVPTVTLEGGERLAPETDFTYTFENNKNVGTASVTVSGTGQNGSGYEGTAIGTFTIAPAPLEVRAKDHSITYGDGPSNDGVTYAGLLGDDTPASLGGSLKYSYDYIQYGNVGNAYAITPRGLMSENYDITYRPGVLTVCPKPVELVWGSTEFTFDGKHHCPTATATGLVNGDEVEVVVEGGQINAGTYTATAVSLSNGNYRLPNDTTTSFTVSRMAITPVVTISDWTYGQDPSEPFVMGNPGNGAISYRFRKKASSVLEWSSVAPSAVGSYLVEATIAETKDYQGGVATAEFTIAKAPPDVVAVPMAKASLVYTGKPQSLVTEGTAQGGTLRYSVDGGATWSDSTPTGTNAGNYVVTYKFIGDANHEDGAIQGPVAVAIAKAGNTLSVVETATVANYGSLDLSQLVKDAAGDITYALANGGLEDCQLSSSTFMAGSTGGTCTVSVTAAGDANHDAVTKDIVITVRETVSLAGATVVLNQTRYTYDGTQKSPGVAAVKLGDAALVKDIDYEVSEPSGRTSAGTYTYIVTGRSGYGGTASASFVIVQAQITGASVMVATQTFDGRAKTPRPTVKLGDRTLAEGADYTLSYTNNTNAGTATVTVTGKGNYTGTKSTTFAIARAKVAVPTGANRTYNGAAQTGVAAGAGYSLSGTWRATEAGSYTAYATPDANHCWPDGSTGARAIVWKIATPAAHVAYRTHVQSFGWQGYVRDGAMSGTSGKAKRLEGINVRLEGQPVGGGIEYRTHVQTYGWQPYRANGAMSGTSGQAKRLEAIQIRLTGQMAQAYDVWYRVHAQSYGWLGWAKNDSPAGTAGLAKRLEGIEIRVLPKGSAAPGQAFGAFVSQTGATPAQSAAGHQVGYRTHVQSFGWQGMVYDGQMSGTQGLAKRLEGIEVSLPAGALGCAGSIEYRTHVQTYGWQPYRRDGQMSGTSGQAKRLEAIQIRLTGQMAQRYDVWYRVHAQTFGWMGWARNDQQAGTAGWAKRLEGIQILVLPKGSPAPGTTAGAFRQR